MNERIRACFQALASQGKRALVPYITAGHPRRDLTVPIMHSLVQSGANIIELGVPFSDPMADGPVIQSAGDKALAQGVGLRQVLGFVNEFRQSDSKTPIVLMGYTNPIERFGLDAFIDAAHGAGVDGLIVVDSPPEESAQIAERCRAKQMDLIFFLAPTSTPDRVAMVAKLATGYVYYVSIRGITGAGHLDTQEVSRKVSALKQQLPLPVGVGFGIRDAQSAQAVGQAADAVIIGTKIIQVLDDGPLELATQRVGEFIAQIRTALDQGVPA